MMVVWFAAKDRALLAQSVLDALQRPLAWRHAALSTMLQPERIEAPAALLSVL
jgi:hypothetical protein